MRSQSTPTPSTPQSVSYKWLARKHGIPADAAKQLLFSFVEAEQPGRRGDLPRRGLVAGPSPPARPGLPRLAGPGPGPQAARRHAGPRQGPGGARALLDPLTALHVFAVAPAQPRDAAALLNADAEQTAELFDEVVGGKSGRAEAIRERALRREVLRGGVRRRRGGVRGGGGEGGARGAAAAARR